MTDTPTNSAGDADTTATTTEHPLTTAYRHDIHKLRGRAHDSAAARLADTPINQPVPYDADRDAALLSRPRGQPEQTVANHMAPYRLALLSGTGATAMSHCRAATPDDIHSLAGADQDQGQGQGQDHDQSHDQTHDHDADTTADPARLHARWLTSEVASAYNESAYYPYTSLKHHVLLMAALCHAYDQGYGFDELWLAATSTAPDTTVETTCDPEAALATDTVVAHETIVWTPAVALHLTPTPGDRPATTIGDAPDRSFGRTWSQLPAHPVDADSSRDWRRRDAQLRRCRAWSTALALLEDLGRTDPINSGDGR